MMVDISAIYLGVILVVSNWESFEWIVSIGITFACYIDMLNHTKPLLEFVGVSV